MTYQKPSLNYGSADESSPFVPTVADAGAATKKKKNVQTLAIVAACFLFFTLGVIYQGNSNDLSEATLLRSAAPVYDPNKDFCFKADGLDQYCWDTTGNFPDGYWDQVDARTSGGCGDMCTKTKKYHCFQAHGHDWKCWTETNGFPDGDWEYYGSRSSSDGCGNECTTFRDYDPNMDTCYQAIGHDWYCWDRTFCGEPLGYWGKVDPRKSGDCGNWCTRTSSKNSWGSWVDDDDYSPLVGAQAQRNEFGG